MLDGLRKVGTRAGYFLVAVSTNNIASDPLVGDRIDSSRAFTEALAFPSAFTVQIAACNAVIAMLDHIAQHGDREHERDRDLSKHLYEF
jgi:hypothetical protein